MTTNLPAIPTKKYFTIGEASQLCAVKPHVLRYWEQEFSHLKPSKRRGNRRYYQQQDIVIIRGIRTLLYDQGFTISGAKQKLTQDKKIESPLNNNITFSNDSNHLLSELESIIKLLK